MKAVRLVLHQSSAHYKKEETVENKMTYPLPPISTVIGAIHTACGYKTYHPMKLSIQGRYESLHKEPYTDYCFLNSTMDDRGILVKMINESLLSGAYERVASAKKSQGNSFRNNITINVENEALLAEFQQLKKLNDEIQKFKAGKMKDILGLIKQRKTRLSSKKKTYDKKLEDYQRIYQREVEIKEFEKELKYKVKEYEEVNYNIPIAKFRSLTTSLKFYEILNEVTLILHIQAEEDVLNDIMAHKYDLTAIGRSEDFVTLEEAEIVELKEYEGEELQSIYSAYIDMNLIKDDTVITKSTKDIRKISGTKYSLNRDYTIVNNQRIFNKSDVLYVSNHSIEETDSTRNLYVDNRKHIVNLL